MMIRVSYFQEGWCRGWGKTNVEKEMDCQSLQRTASSASNYTLFFGVEAATGQNIGFGYKLWCISELQFTTTFPPMTEELDGSGFSAPQKSNVDLHFDTASLAPPTLIRLGTIHA